jgi:pilus assembly protein CpaB
MAVKIDDVAGISGLIQPNSRVDVLVTLRTDPTGNRQVAKLFMENMRVLSVGTKVQRGEDGKAINATTATLEVSPDEAERLAVAMNQGSIQLVLRGFGDPDSVRTTGANSSDVLAQLRTGGSANVSAGRVNGAGGEVSDERRATTTARSRSRRSAAPRTPPVTTPAAPATSSVVVPPAAPDSATVRVYRGGTLSQQKFPKADTNATRPRATTP